LKIERNICIYSDMRTAGIIRSRLFVRAGSSIHRSQEFDEIMGKRNDQERDQCIDMLIARVQELESEVLRLKSQHGVGALAVSTPKENIAPAKAVAAFEPPRRKSAKLSSSATLENIIGTRWIGAISIVAVILGVSFFLKYSFDNNLIGEAGRVMLGIVGGIAFLGTGEYLQQKKNLAACRT
jgi:hypothetical protein